MKLSHVGPEAPVMTVRLHEEAAAAMGR
jgi:hypothetical protein